MFTNYLLIAAFYLAVSFLFSARLLFDGPQRLRRAFFACRFSQYFSAFSLVNLFPWDVGSFSHWRLLMMVAAVIALAVMGIWSKRLDKLARTQEAVLGLVRD
jgi:hypothetical protein